MTEQNLALARRAYEAWNTGDIAWLLEHATDDFTIRPLSRYIDLEDVYEGECSSRAFPRVLPPEIIRDDLLRSAASHCSASGIRLLSRRLFR